MSKKEQPEKQRRRTSKKEEANITADTFTTRDRVNIIDGTGTRSTGSAFDLAGEGGGDSNDYIGGFLI